MSQRFDYKKLPKCPMRRRFHRCVSHIETAIEMIDLIPFAGGFIELITTTLKATHTLLNSVVVEDTNEYTQAWNGIRASTKMIGRLTSSHLEDWEMDRSITEHSISSLFDALETMDLVPRRAALAVLVGDTIAKSLKILRIHLVMAELGFAYEDCSASFGDILYEMTVTEVLEVVEDDSLFLGTSHHGVVHQLPFIFTHPIVKKSVVDIWSQEPLLVPSGDCHFPHRISSKISYDVLFYSHLVGTVTSSSKFWNPRFHHINMKSSEPASCPWEESQAGQIDLNPETERQIKEFCILMEKPMLAPVEQFCQTMCHQMSLLAKKLLFNDTIEAYLRVEDAKLTIRNQTIMHLRQCLRYKQDHPIVFGNIAILLLNFSNQAESFGRGNPARIHLAARALTLSELVFLRTMELDGMQNVDRLVSDDPFSYPGTGDQVAHYASLSFRHFCPSHKSNGRTIGKGMLFPQATLHLTALMVRLDKINAMTRCLHAYVSCGQNVYSVPYTSALSTLLTTQWARVRTTVSELVRDMDSKLADLLSLPMKVMLKEKHRDVLDDKIHAKVVNKAAHPAEAFHQIEERLKVYMPLLLRLVKSLMRQKLARDELLNQVTMEADPSRRLCWNRYEEKRTGESSCLVAKFLFDMKHFVELLPEDSNLREGMDDLLFRYILLEEPLVIPNKLFSKFTL